MFKILFSILLMLSVANAEVMGKSGGCTLTQEGEFHVGFNDVNLDGVEYIGIAQSGKNFREIFVGSKVIINSKRLSGRVNAVILDYKPNKRIKGKPKTGIFIVAIRMKKYKTTLPMEYSFKDGIMSAEADLKLPSKNESSLKVWFKTPVAYSLCYSK